MAREEGYDIKTISVKYFLKFFLNTSWISSKLTLPPPPFLITVLSRLPKSYSLFSSVWAQMEKTELLVKKVCLSETEGHACGSVCGFCSVLPKCVNLVMLQPLVDLICSLQTSCMLESSSQLSQLISTSFYFIYSVCFELSKMQCSLCCLVWIKFNRNVSSSYVTLHKTEGEFYLWRSILISILHSVYMYNYSSESAEPEAVQ